MVSHHKKRKGVEMSHIRVHTVYGTLKGVVEEEREAGREISASHTRCDKFPKDAEIRAKWTAALRRDNFKPTNGSTLCSKHFDSDCFEKSGWTTRANLKQGSIPTIFDFPEHLQRNVAKRKPPKQRDEPHPKKSIEANTEPSSDDDNRLGDHEANSHDDSLDVVESHVTDESPDVMDLSSKSVEMNKEKQKTFRKSYVGDFIENDMQDPRKARQFFRTAQGRIQQNRKYIKVLRQTVRRKTEKIASMEQLVDHLENQKLVTQPAGEKGKYPVELRKFALTLSFYSTRAYKYVRKKFSNALPSVRTMQKWYQTVDGTPGFHEESLRAIKMKVADAQASGNKKVLLALSVDGVYIRKKIQWVGDKYIGYVNCGENIDGDNLPQASQALVFLLTCLNMRWKIPVAYFLINSMDDEQQAGLITKFLELTHETGAHVVSVTFDGHASNVSTAKCLGADIFSESIPTSFPHPITEQPIEVILDPCHMLKLIRNTLATKKKLYDSKGRQIKWYYIEELVKIQNDEGLHLATRVRSRHMRWYKEKMKSKRQQSIGIFTQIQYLWGTIKGSEATKEFIIAINDAFDILNSGNRFGNSFKAALQERNKNAYFDRIQNIIEILKGVKDRDNKTLIIKSKTRTGFLGMIAALQSVQNLYGRLVETGLLSYFCTYKISQDHIEVFFSAIRAKGGFNNNPTCRQFEAAYKRLLIHHEMSGPSTANCIELTPISILTVSSGKEKIVSEINPICIRSLELDDECEYPKTKGNDNGEIVLHLTTEHMRNMSEYVNDVVGHETLPDAGTRELYARLSSGEKGKYPVELRKFALTLSFYSTRAYKYVRKKFSNALPSVRTMQKWYQTVDGTPGFHEESLRAIKMKVADAQASGNKKVLLALSVDGVYIRKKIQWVGDKYIGYVNCGENIDGDNLPQASQALVFLLTCLNMRWKIPVAYFLINSMDDEQQAGLITKFLELTHETGAHVVSVTFDGHASNVSTAKCLGADIFSESIPTSFPHPITEQPIEVILDPCHMLKLIRNTLATKKKLYDSKGRQIKWYYIEELVKIQNDEGLHLATRVRSRHMRWYKEKMKSKRQQSIGIFTQIQYLWGTIKGSEATKEFIIAINDAFDILNSGNRFGNSFKAALQERNKNAYFDRIQNIIEILKGVKDRDNKTLIIKSKTRTGFLGMIAALQSVQNLYGCLVETGLLSFFCTYKISQDHIEVFFSAIRAKGGFNNNPTCRQVEAAYKRLLIYHEMSGPSTANCIELTPISILTVSSGKEKVVSEINPICIRSLELDDECEYPKTKVNDNGEIVLHLTTEHMRNMSEYVNDVVGHVAGLTLKKLKKVVHCETCLDALETGDYISKLSAIKNYDDAPIGLQKPSQDLIDICTVTEAQILLMEKCNMLRNTTNLATRIQINVLSNVGNRCFDSLTSDHMFDEIFEGNHIIALMKLIIKTYTDIRLHHDTNKLNELTLGDRVRSILTHSILFKGQ
ncbi:hypothetical protein B566_EDAN017934 [Ephemera danica]|nr:hypothetical protein B566_EDAN017934 [Ephemera danica]